MESHLTLGIKVECLPLCSIKWMKNGKKIEVEDPKFTIKESVSSSDPFPHVNSTLSWNLKHFQNNKLDHEEGNFIVSCLVEKTEIGQQIVSRTNVSVECKEI